MSQMVAFEVINARECTLTDITAEMLVRSHGGPGRRGISGVKERPETSGGNDIGVRGGERVRYWYFSSARGVEVTFGLF